MDHEKLVDDMTGLLSEIQSTSMPSVVESIDRLEMQLGSATRPLLEAFAAEIWDAFTTAAGGKLAERIHTEDNSALKCPSCDEHQLIHHEARLWICHNCGYREMR